MIIGVRPKKKLGELLIGSVHQDMSIMAFCVIAFGWCYVFECLMLLRSRKHRPSLKQMLLRVVVAEEGEEEEEGGEEEEEAVLLQPFLCTFKHD